MYLLGDERSSTPELNSVDVGWSICEPKGIGSSFPKIKRHSKTCIAPSESAIIDFWLEEEEEEQLIWTPRTDLNKIAFELKHIMNLIVTNW